MNLQLQEQYMHRCLELAALGQGSVAPNPMVGAVLVHNDRIIGEGFHQRYGGPHAEVHCINSVNKEDNHLIEESTLFVSLEPCAHFGKTPPCADLIIEKKIPEVIIGCRDPFVQVNGKGIEKLLEAGVAVQPGILEKECIALNKRFFIFHTQHRPYIVLKWAQTLDGKIAGEKGSRLRISNEYTNRLVHRWRSEEMSILVGRNTALTDDPELTTRLWAGTNPIRLVVDRDLRLPNSLKLFDGSVPTIVFNFHQHTISEQVSQSPSKDSGTLYYQITNDTELVHQILHALYQMKIQSLLVEGGSYLLQSFIDEGLWDEARVITNQSMSVGGGLPAPKLIRQSLKKEERIFSDTIHYFEKV